MSASEFTNTFSGDPNTRVSTCSISSVDNPEIALSNITIGATTVSLNAILNTSGETTVLPISGTLAAGYKTNQDINSIIIEVADQIKGYTVLLFEIYNDTAEDMDLLTTSPMVQTLGNTPHIRLYLQGPDDDVFLFEFEMPVCFAALNSSDYPAADAYKDVYWAWDLVVHETASIPTDAQMSNMLIAQNQSRALGAFSTLAYGETFYDSFYIALRHYEIWSLPYIEYKHTNVSSADSTWIASFKVSERVDIDGTMHAGTPNPFVYKNLKIALAAGANTTFIRTFQEGHFDDSWGNTLAAGSRVAVSILKHIVGTIPYSSTFLTALEWISAMSSVNTNIVLGSQNIDLADQKVTAVGEHLGTYRFYRSTARGGDYFTLHAVTQSEGATNSKNTTGALVVSFDIEFNNTLEVADPFQIQLDYTVQP